MGTLRLSSCRGRFCCSATFWMLLVAAVAGLEEYDEAPPGDLDTEMAYQDDNNIDTGATREQRHTTPDLTAKDLLLYRLISSLQSPGVSYQKHGHRPNWISTHQETRNREQMNSELSEKDGMVKRLTDMLKGSGKNIGFKGMETMIRPQQKWKIKKGKALGNKPLPFISLSKTAHPADQAAGTLSLYIAEHCSILSVDHLTDACKNVFKTSPAATELKLHRTKCTEIINYVLAPHFRTVLLQDVGDQKFSLLIDESTDVSVLKYLGIVIRYFSEKHSKIVSAFLALVKLDTSDAKGIADSLVACVREYNLQLENMIGIGTDNASVMVGVNNGVHAILKRDYGLENLILVRCICHSLQLAVSHASENTIPRNIEFFVREIYSWFSVSPKRREEYKKVFQLINCGEEPLKLLKVCETRWLSIEPAVVKIIAQWEELKLHFNLVRSKDNCYAAELLNSMLNDEVTKYYLLFLRGVLNDVQIAIKSFEGENTNPLKLLNALATLLRSICTRILTPSAQAQKKYVEDPIHESDINPTAYLGYAFETALRSSQLQTESKLVIKKRCVEFLVKLIQQLQQRLPTNYKQLEKMSLLSPEEACKAEKDFSIAELAKMFGFSDEKIDKIMQQWSTIHFEKWQSSDVVQFWVDVKNFKTASGDKAYKDLSDLAMTALALPHSNAEVERLFSMMSIIKSKHRNRMGLLTLNSILRIRDFLKKNSETCATYQIPESVIKEIGKSKKPEKNEKEAGPSTSQDHNIIDTGVDDDVLSEILLL